MDRSCFLFGHADCPDSVMPILEQAVERFYTNFQVRYFYVGNRGRFDSLAAAAVKRAKKAAQRYFSAASAGLSPRRASRKSDGGLRQFLLSSFRKCSQTICYCPGKQIHGEYSGFHHLLCEPHWQHKKSIGVCKAASKGRMDSH